MSEDSARRARDSPSLPSLSPPSLQDDASPPTRFRAFRVTSPFEGPSSREASRDPRVPFHSSSRALVPAAPPSPLRRPSRRRARASPRRSRPSRAPAARATPAPAARRRRRRRREPIGRRDPNLDRPGARSRRGRDGRPRRRLRRPQPRRPLVEHVLRVLDLQTGRHRRDVRHLDVRRDARRRVDAEETPVNSRTRERVSREVRGDASPRDHRDGQRVVPRRRDIEKRRDARLRAARDARRT